jgi:hypothetical protein
MSMRDQIAEVLEISTDNVNDIDGTFEDIARAGADAILAALPDMIAPLVWEHMIKGGYWRSQSALGIYECGFGDGWWAALDGYQYWEWEPEEDPRSYSTEFAAQAAANTHHRATIMAAFTGETL